MRLYGIIASAAIGVFGMTALGWPQAPPPRAEFAGKVTAINAQAGEITVESAKGQSIVATATAKTAILHALPGETDPRKWPRMETGAISPGDEIVVYYRGSLEQKPLNATTLVVRTASDLSQLAQGELADWKARGTKGIVDAVDPAADTMTVKVGQRTVTVRASDKTKWHRYSPDSPKPADATASSLAEVHAGDQVNVLGNHNPDGSIAAEQVYSGAFRQIAATIVSIDAAKGEMEVKDLATKKPLTIRITPETTMKKLPEQLAQMLARRYRGGGRGETMGAGMRGGMRGGMAAGGAPQGAAGGPGMGRGGDLGSILDRLPVMPLSELKPKDAVMVSTTAGSDPNRVTVIMLLAGVEPILTAAPTATRDIMSGWNLGGGGEGGGEGN
jgi:Domain of unknown function (DUF5666)